MHTLRLLLLIVLLPLGVAAQETDARDGARISSVQISGLDADDLSPGLRAAIDALTGTPLDFTVVWELAARIEGERPDKVVAARAIASPNDEARVIFMVARLEGDRSLTTNINSRYTVERVEIDGIPDADVSQDLRDELQTLVGQRLDHRAAERLAERLRDAVPGYDIGRRVERGERRGQVRLIFTFRKSESTRWVQFTPTRSKFLFHTDQGWSGFLDAPIRGREFRIMPFFAIDNRDDLLEEYSGIGVRVEARNIGSERLGVGVEFAHFTQTWQPETLAAVPVEAPYRTRDTVAPWITFAASPQLRFSGGVSITELESQSFSPASQSANVFTLSAGYSSRWRTSAGRHDVDVSLGLRASAGGLSSDLDYDRYLGAGRYEYVWSKSLLVVTGQAGRINGDAPLFERFTLGDSATLRGWNKYDIAPAGGSRVVHSSIEYRYRGLAFFLDSGSVWDTESAFKTSTGFGYHRDNFFATLGFPLNTDDLRTAFMIGVRF